MAARMESLGAPGAVVVHGAAAQRWADETGRPAPATAHVACKGKAAQPAAVFDCAAGQFCGPAECAAFLAGGGGDAGLAAAATATMTTAESLAAKARPLPSLRRPVPAGGRPLRKSSSFS